jgi:hypothetical protein
MAKAVAKALYLEMTKRREVSQIVMTPPMYDAVKDITIPARILARKLSPSHPRRNWQSHTSNKRFDAAPVFSAPSAKLVVEATLPVFGALADYFTGYLMGDWSMEKDPVVVDISYEDFADVAEQRNPNALIRRIMRARKEAGYEELFAPTPTPPIVMPEPEPIIAYTDGHVLTASGVWEERSIPAYPTPDYSDVVISPPEPEKYDAETLDSLRAKLREISDGLERKTPSGF